MDETSKRMLDRVNLTEKHFSCLCTAFGDLAYRYAKSRDTKDNLARSLRDYAVDETINETTSNTMMNIAQAMTLLADLKDLEVNRVSTKIVQELAQWEDICCNAKEELRSLTGIMEKKQSRMKHLEHVKNLRTKNLASIELNSRSDSNTSANEMHRIMKHFEKMKITQIREILRDFIQIEMKHHAKSLEVLSAAFQDVNAIDEVTDLQSFQEATANLEEQGGSDKLMKSSLRSHSMASLTSIFGAKKKLAKLKVSRSSTGVNVDDTPVEPSKDVLVVQPDAEKIAKNLPVHIKKDTHEDDYDEDDDTEDYDEESSESSGGESEDSIEDMDEPEKDSNSPILQIPHSLKFREFCEGVEVTNDNQPKSKMGSQQRVVSIRAINGVFKKPNK